MRPPGLIQGRAGHKRPLSQNGLQWSPSTYTPRTNLVAPILRGAGILSCLELFADADYATCKIRNSCTKIKQRTSGFKPFVMCDL
jgi:hypothetical protein